MATTRRDSETRMSKPKEMPKEMPKETPREMSSGQRAYEARRAAKAGLSMDKWLAAKERDRVAEEKAKAKATEPPKPEKPPGFLRRLLERAQRPLGS